MRGPYDGQGSTPLSRASNPAVRLGELLYSLEQCGVELARPNQQLDQPRIGFRCRKRVGAIDPHRDLPPGAPQPYRHGQKLGFVVGLARQWRRDIEERTEPGRPEMDVDLIGPHIDALDQGCKEGTLACSGQLGPALPDLGGAGDEPALRRQIRKLCRLVDIAGIEKPLTDSADHELFDLRGRKTQSGRSLRLMFGDQWARDIVVVPRVFL